MNATLYFNKSEDIVVWKDIVLTGSVNIVDREGDLDLLSPTVVLSGVSEDVIFASNYIYIDTLKRYYYIKNINMVRNGVFRLVCQVDVLYTYREYIAQQSGIVGRQENNYNMNLSDSLMRGNANPVIQTLRFPTSFNDFTGENIIIASA